MTEPLFLCIFLSGVAIEIMDYTENKVEMAEEGLLERLVITEEGDMTEATSSSLVIIQSCSGEMALKKEEEHKGENKHEEGIASKVYLKEPNPEKQQTNAEDDQTGEVVVNEDKPEKAENLNDGLNREDSESEGQPHEIMRINEKPEKASDTEDEKVTENDPVVDIERFNLSEQQPEGTQSQEEDSKKVCGLLLFCFGFVICPGITFRLSYL